MVKTGSVSSGSTDAQVRFPGLVFGLAARPDCRVGTVLPTVTRTGVSLLDGVEHVLLGGELPVLDLLDVLADGLLNNRVDIGVLF